MANELIVTWSITMDKQPPNAAVVADNIFKQLGNISTGKKIQSTCLAPHSAPAAIPLGDCSGNCGYFSFNNPSPTETIQILTASDGDVFIEAAPGRNSGLIPVPAAFAPYAKATGSLDVEFAYTIIAR